VEENIAADKRADFLSNPNYERRLVVFCDILGWRAKIAQAGTDATKIGELRRIILQLTRLLRLESPHDIRVSSFSDNIVMSQAVETEKKTLFFIQQLGPLIAATAMGGFLLRGGITIGDLIHDDEVVFGPALNRAYELESTVADYPRMVLDQGPFSVYPQLPTLVVKEGEQLFLDPFRVKQMEFIISLQKNHIRPDIVEAGLPFSPRNIKGTPGDIPLKAILNVLKTHIAGPLEDKEWRKVAWLYDRIAKELGVPPASSYPRVRPGDVT
jgi:hypothetical protein